MSDQPGDHPAASSVTAPLDAGTDDALSRSTVRRVAGRLMPFLLLLYFVNYLDRTNIGFAGPNGLTEELHISQAVFGLASGIFFIGYLILEVPSNLALRRFGARRWLARIMVTWGIIASLTSLVPNGGWLVAIRFVLGIAEAGFFPGIIFYITLWFPQRERARAVAIFMAAVPLSTAIGSTVSSLIISGGDGAFGLSGWRFMFLVEGIPAVLLGVICWFFLTDTPDKATWLSDEQRGWLASRLDEENTANERLHGSDLKKALLSGRVLALSFVYFGIVYGLYALGFFLPTIIAGFQAQFGTKYSVIEKGLITAIPYAIGAIVMVVWGRHGDRTNERTWHVAIPAGIGGIAIPIALYLHSPFAVMVLIAICAIGVCCALPTFWALPTRFLTGAAAAGGLALINSLGNLSGFVAPYVTGWLSDATGSNKTGLWVVGVMMVAAAVTAIALRAAPRREREAADAG